MRRSLRRGGARSRRGFSLLEVLVAFVIMATSLGALYSALGGSVRGFAAAEGGVRAALLAESLFALYEVVPEGGVDLSGSDGDRLQWRLMSEPFDVGVELPPWKLARLTAVVSWDDRGEVRSLSLWTLRPVEETL